MKKNKTSALRLIGATIFALMAAIFVHAHSFLQANRLRYGDHLELEHLPVLTAVFGHHSGWGYMLPGLAVAGFFLSFDNAARQELLEQLWPLAVCLAALAWLLLCVLAWQLPYYYPISVIE